MDTLISVCHQLSVAQLVERWTVVGLSQSHPSVTGSIPVWEILSFLGKWQTAKMISCWMGCRKSKFKHQVLCQAGSEFGWFFHVIVWGRLMTGNGTQAQSGAHSPSAPGSIIPTHIPWIELTAWCVLCCVRHYWYWSPDSMSMLLPCLLSLAREEKENYQDLYKLGLGYSQYIIGMVLLLGWGRTGQPWLMAMMEDKMWIWLHLRVNTAYTHSSSPR